MQSTLKLAVSAALAFTSVQAVMKPGKCPAHPQNKDIATFDAYSMAGLWFEYVWDSDFSFTYDYKCSTWIVLSDEADSGPGQYIVYNNLVFPPAEEGGDDEHSYMKFKFEWEGKTDAGQKAAASYTRISEDETDYKIPKAGIQFIDTDYHSYVVGA